MYLFYYFRGTGAAPELSRHDRPWSSIGRQPLPITRPWYFQRFRALIIIYILITVWSWQTALIPRKIWVPELGIYKEYRRKRPICENALIEHAWFFLLFTTVYFFFFSFSFLFFSFLVLFFLVIYVHSRVSSSVVSGVHFFFAGLYSHKNTPESCIWPPWIHFTGLSAHATLYVTLKHWNKVRKWVISPL